MSSSKTLKALLPSLKDDKDEDWMVHLSLEKKAKIRKHRRDWLFLKEQFEEFESDYKKYLDDNKHKSEKELLASRESHRAMLEKFQTKRNKMIAVMISDVSRLKEEALKIKKDSIRQWSDEIGQRQQMNILESDVFDIEDDIELVPDDYLPNLPTVETKVKIKPVPMAVDSRSTTPSDYEPEVSEPKIDPLVEGVDPMDAEILVELRSLINKYGCRDGVLKAIQSFRARDRSLKALEALSKMTEMCKMQSTG